MIPVVVISLLRSSERRKATGARLDALGLAFKFHDAIDGNLFTETDATRLCPRRASIARRFILSKQEIACLESHKQCLQAAIESGAPFTCILEDDAWIEGDIGEFLDPTWLGNIAPFDVLKLGGDSDKASDDLAVPLGTYRYRHVCVPLHPMYSAIGYIVTQAGAKKLLSHIRKMG